MTGKLTPPTRAARRIVTGRKDSEMNKPTTRLERAVLAILKDNSESGKAADILSTAKDVTQYGCQSGCISQLIYYHDTVKFYKRHQKEIDQMLAELVSDVDEPPEKIFRDWDRDDPLARDDYNQNMLAWFGFEEATRRLFDL